MRHDNVLQGVNRSFADLCTFVRTQTENPFEKDFPDLFEVDRVGFLLNDRKVGVRATVVLRDLFGCVISHVLEHSNRNQVVINVASRIACIHVDGIEDCDEVLLAQAINVVADHKFEAAEPACYDLVALVLQRLANGHNNDPPAFILDLLPASLNDLFKALDDGEFVRVMVAFELLSEWHQHRILPCAILPAFITTSATSTTPLFSTATL